MEFNSEKFGRINRSTDFAGTDEIHNHPPMLSPTNAWRILRRRTGGPISRSTFYRWLDSGKVFSFRMGSRMYVPWQELQDVIGRCLNGEPF